MTTRSRSGYWPPRPYRPLPLPAAGAACFRFARPLLRRSGRGRRTRDEEANTTDRTSLDDVRPRSCACAKRFFEDDVLELVTSFTRTRSARRYPGWKKEWEPRDPDPRVSVGSVEVQGDDSWTDDKPVDQDRPTDHSLGRGILLMIAPGPLGEWSGTYLTLSLARRS